MWTLDFGFVCERYIIRRVCVCVYGLAIDGGSLRSMQLISRLQLGPSYRAAAALLHPFYVL